MANFSEISAVFNKLFARSEISSWWLPHLSAMWPWIDKLLISAHSVPGKEDYKSICLIKLLCGIRQFIRIKCMEEWLSGT